MEYFKGTPPLYLQGDKYIYNQYLGGLPEFLKKKNNYRILFK